MDRIEWTSDLELGHPQVDGEHRRLVDLYNKIVDAGKARNDVDPMQPLMFLADYVKIHFRSEEDLMTEDGYPGLGEHAGLHARLVRDVEHRVQRFIAGEDADMHELATFLRGWLVDHIQGQDRAYVDWRRARNVAPTSTSA